MRVKLRSFFVPRLIALLILLFSVEVGYVRAQLAIEGLTPHELTFSLSQQRTTGQTTILSVSSLDSISRVESEGIPGSLFPVLGESESGVEDQYWAREDENGVVSVGKNRITGSGSANFFSVSYQNYSPEAIGGLTLAFDFEYEEKAAEMPFVMVLQLRVNRGEWQPIGGGEIRPAMLESRSDGWNTVSVQANIESVYLRNRDIVDFRWVVNTTAGEAFTLPMGLQRVELDPRPANPARPEAGTLLITEILPAQSADGKAVEYLEIYNSADYPVSLKGAELSGPGGEWVVQEDFEISPYGYAVLANRAAAGIADIEPAVVYNGTLFPGTEGTAELRINDTLLQSLRYQHNNSRRALELTGFENALRGTIPVSDLTSSETPLQNGFSGTPGGAGNRSQLFSKKLSGEGWYLISLPGYWMELRTTTARQATPIRNLENQPVTAGELNAGEPFLLYNENNGPKMLYSQKYNDQNLEPFLSSLDDFSILAGFPAPDNVRPSELVNEQNERVAPVVMRWNGTAQRFELIFDETGAVPGWEPMILNRSAAKSLTRAADRGQVRGEPLNRYIQFKLFEEQRGRAVLADENALLGFLSSGPGLSSVRYDLPKLLPISDDVDADQELSLLYLSGPEGAPAQSFTHYPFELDQAITIPVGHFSSKSSRNFTLNWAEMEGIPDEWILTLEDTHTGHKIDMKEVTEYTFRHSGGERIDKQDEEETTPLRVFVPGKAERFVVTIEPYRGAFRRSAEQAEKPGSVELGQNYPNPFNPSTTITYYLPEERNVKLGIYNVVGQQVATLVDERRPEGEHSITWNASEMPSGIYIVQLEIGNRMLTRKITLIK